MSPHFMGFIEEIIPNIKNGTYLININEYANIGTNWVAISIKNDTATYIDGFGVEHIPKKVKRLIGNKMIKANIYRILAYYHIMFGCFCIGFIDFMLNNGTVTELFFPGKKLKKKRSNNT